MNPTLGKLNAPYTIILLYFYSFDSLKIKIYLYINRITDIRHVLFFLEKYGLFYKDNVTYFIFMVTSYVSTDPLEACGLVSFRNQHPDVPHVT